MGKASSGDVPTAVESHAGSPVGTPIAPPGRGTSLGRFLVLDVLGVGGMGVVLAGYDPELDRRVALKLIRTDWPGAAGEEARARLLREAQAMARLSHPNVVTVYQAGSVDDQLFIAMELVDGETLKAWLLAERRPWRECVRVFLDAGRGLAAAHAAGLVHRDFKPDNVLLGKDGRVRVTDFGLVAATGEGPTPAAEQQLTSSGKPLEHTLTTTGAVMGTPVYMAPEQHRGEAADARADQFAFCVALHEALYGERPFSGDSVSELAAAVRAGVVREPRRDADVPGWVRAVVLRGLSPQPDARWPSMAALLDALGRDPAVRRRRRALVALAAALVALATWGVIGARARSAAVCAGAREQLAGVWDDARRAEVRARFEATGLAYAGATFERVAARLDDHATAWTRSHTQACRATRVHRSQSERALDLRMACLARRRSELAALTSLYAEAADATVVERAVQAAAGLSPIAACDDVAALDARAPLELDPAGVTREAGLRVRLDRGEALRGAGKYAEALALASAVAADAERLGLVRLRAQALTLVGQVHEKTDDFKQAEPALAEAARLAAGVRDDETMVEALTELAWVIGSDGGRFGEAMQVARAAEIALARAGLGGELASQLDSTVGELLGSQGKTAEARARLEAALAAVEAQHGPNSLEVARVLVSLASNAEEAGDFPRARALGERSLAIWIEVLGPEHPNVAATLNNLGMVALDEKQYRAADDYFGRSLAIKARVFGADSPAAAQAYNNLAIVAMETGRLDEAAALYERALRIREQALGPEHPNLASTLGNLGGVRRAQGRFDEALALHQRALAIKVKAFGEEHPKVANTLGNLAYLYMDLGRWDEAEALFERQLAIRRKTQGEDHDDTGAAMSSLAQLLERRGRCREARPLAERALLVLEKARGADSPGLAFTLATLGRCAIAERRLADAVVILERALAVVVKGEGGPEDAAGVRHELARALWERGGPGDRERAVALAAEAEAALAGVKAGAGTEVDRLKQAIAAWRRAHAK